MRTLSPNLRICFYLRVLGDFYDEKKILAELSEMKKLAKKGKIDLYTTEGAISICSENTELLGRDFWDEINQIARGLIYQFDKLVAGQNVEEFLPLQTFYLRLYPLNDDILYELESKTKLRPLNVKQKVPRRDFIREFVLMYLRLTKVLAELGSRSFSDEETQWAKSLPAFIAELVDESDLAQIEKAARSPLNELIQ